MMTSDDAWKLLQHVYDWIKVADTKAGALLGASGVLGGIIVHILPKASNWALSPWQTGLSAVSLALTGTSMVISIRVFAPRLRTQSSGSPLYFAHIATENTNGTEFKLKFDRLTSDTDEMSEALCDQIWESSRIARRKLRLVASATWLFTSALLTASIVGILKGF
ncbi:Pycsar system effector family protein [Amycolatopsis umgeniensis]|uniref:Pycsar system effector family protein n=1 Tax=Amycolatopsis umgeniensis TaxID=336628 RepID=UPI001C8747C7